MDLLEKKKKKSEKHLISLIESPCCGHLGLIIIIIDVKIRFLSYVEKYVTGIRVRIDPNSLS